MKTKDDYDEPCSSYLNSLSKLGKVMKPDDMCSRCGFPRFDHMSTQEIQSEIKEIEKSEDRRFPIQGGFSITWGDAEKAYREYKRLCGGSQTLERLGERGGFGLFEFAMLWCPMSDNHSINRYEVAIQKVLRESSLRVED